MKLTKLVGLSCIILATSFNAFAVDGYKSIKFGASKNTVKKSGICTFRGQTTISDSVNTLDCDDLSFSGSKASASAIFVDGKFERFAILIDESQILPLAGALNKKYGRPDRNSSTKAQWNAIDTTPNTQAFIWFDNGTVLLQVTNDANMNRESLLVYTAPDYSQKVMNTSSKSLADDV